MDLLKELGDGELKIMTALVNKIYMNRDWPKDFLDVTMIVLPKKNQAKKCSEHRKISPISYTGKWNRRGYRRRPVWDFKIRGRVINKVRFADDMSITAKSQEELQDIVNRLVHIWRNDVMEININKSQVMRVYMSD